MINIDGMTQSLIRMVINKYCGVSDIPQKGDPRKKGRKPRECLSVCGQMVN